MTAPPVVASYPEATSILGRNIQTLRAMLSRCAKIQTLFSAADATEALTRIYLGCLPRPADGRRYTTEELNAYRPFAIVGPSPNLIISSQVVSSIGTWSHSRMGQCDILIERSFPTGGDDEDDQKDFAWIDLVDGIRQSNDTDEPGLLELHETAGNLSIKSSEILSIYRGDEAEIQMLGDYQAAVLRIQWGRI